MSRPGYWMRLLAVAAGYAAAFFLAQRAVPFSVTSPWFVFVAMVCFLGLAFVAQPLLMIRMPRPLRPIRAWEGERGLYRSIGVPAFGRLLRRPPLRLFNMDVYFRKGAGDMARVGAELEAAEASHFLAAALVAPYMIYALAHRMWGALFWISLAQVLINAYPVMHLRLTRYRLDRLASKKSARPERTPRERATYRSPSTR